MARFTVSRLAVFLLTFSLYANLSCAQPSVGGIFPPPNGSGSGLPGTFTDISTPASPSSGSTKVYTKGGKVCSVSSAGVETCSGASGGTGDAASVVTSTFSATPNFPCPSSSNGTTTVFKLSTTISEAVTSSTLATCTIGQTLIFVLQQNGTGGWPFAWPTGFSQACTVSPIANAITKASFAWDGTTAQLLSCAADLGPLIFSSEAAASGTPPAGTVYCWMDSTDHSGWECKANGSATIYRMTSLSAATLAFLDPTSSVQTQMDLKAPKASPIFTGTPDSSGAAHTLPLKVGTSLPGTCTAGELYFKTDATAGQNIYECASTNTWTQQLNSGGGGTTVVGPVGFQTTFDGGGSALTAGTTVARYIRIPQACTITGYSIIVDAGTATFKTWRKAAGTAIPTISDSISTAGVAISSGTVVNSSTVSDWTDTTLDAGDIIAINLSAVATATLATFQVRCDGLGSLPDGQGVLGSFLTTAIAAPSTPAAGKGSIYVDSTTKNLAVKDDAGVIRQGIQVTTCTNQFFRAVAGTGVVTCATVVNADITSLDAATKLTGIAPSANGGIGNGFTKITGPTTSEKTFTLPDASATLTITVASGTSALGTSAISANSCATVVTTTATGTASTDAISWSPNADISGVTGYGILSTDGLKIYPYPTTNNVNWRVCNGTGTSITPGAVTLNFRVTR